MFRAVCDELGWQKHFRPLGVDQPAVDDSTECPAGSGSVGDDSHVSDEDDTVWEWWPDGIDGQEAGGDDSHCGDESIQRLGL